MKSKSIMPKPLRELTLQEWAVGTFWISFWVGLIAVLGWALG